MQDNCIQAGDYLQVASDAHPEISAENAPRRLISIFTVDLYFETSQLYEFCMAVANLQTVLKPSIDRPKFTGKKVK